MAGVEPQCDMVRIGNEFCASPAKTDGVFGLVIGCGKSW